MTGRFTLRWKKDCGTGYVGWAGRLIDSETGLSHPVRQIAGDGHGAAFVCGFETKAQFIKEARRVANRITRAG